MKLRDITNSKCDVRKYMSIEVSDEARYELENWDYDVDDVLSQACISVDGHKLDDEITPFNVEKYLELNKNQQIVLEWLKWSVKEQGNSPMDAVYLLVLGETLVSVSLAYIALTPDQQTQVLAVFSKEVSE